MLAFGVAAVIACSNGLGPWGLGDRLLRGRGTDVLLSWGWCAGARLRHVSIAMWKELIGYGRLVLASNVVLGPASRCRRS